jgi:hypothetical protein
MAGERCGALTLVGRSETVDNLFELGDAAHGTGDVETTLVDDREPRGVIPAVLEAFESFKEK